MFSRNLFILLNLFSICCLSQNVFIDRDFDRLASNLGGKREFKRFFYQELVYPKESLSKNIGGKVVLQFVVMSDSSIRDLKIKKSINKEMDEEAIRIFKLLLWEPSVLKGEPVNTYTKLVFNFNPKKHKKICKKRDYDQPALNSLLSDTSLKIYTKVDEPAKCIEGIEKLYMSIQNKLDYPSVAKIQGIEGTVLICFVVEQDGNISNLHVKKGIGGGCDEEAIQITENLKWSPAIYKNKHVRYKMTLPIEFKLNRDFHENSHGEQKQY